MTGSPGNSLYQLPCFCELVQTLAMTDNNKNKALPDTTGEDFFIPNLCDSQHLLMLVVVAELLAVLLVLAGTGALSPFPWNRLLGTSFLVLWIALVTAFLLCRLRPLLLRLPRATAAGVSFGIMLAVIAVFSVVADQLLRKLHLVNPATISNVYSYQYVVRNILIGAIISGLVLRYFYLQEQLRAKQRAELTARVQALQSRIRPHFLFNSMNIIASLIHVDPDKAEQAVEDLSELFRASLKPVSEVSLNDELMLCQRYINIEELRLGDRLHVEWRLREVPEFVKIPLLTLQPLIENAIYHGVEPRLERSTVRINVEYTGREVVIIMTNPIGKAVHARGNRMAIANVRQRLHAHYGDSAKLTTTADQELFTTYLSYPLSPAYQPRDKSNTIREQGVQA
jgi:two-component system sensor histidine kinase AlgZ